MLIRKAENKDIDGCIKLLKQVCQVHADIRPDLFKGGMTKYTNKELEEVFKNELTPVFVCVEDDIVLGYCFTQIIITDNNVTPKPYKTLYIDDLCVDEINRGKHIGRKLYDYAIKYAKDINCYNVTLNVWEGNNSAKAFYEKMGMHSLKTYMEKII